MVDLQRAPATPAEAPPGVPRRNVLRWLAAIGGTAAVGAVTSPWWWPGGRDGGSGGNGGGVELLPVDIGDTMHIYNTMRENRVVNDAIAKLLGTSDFQYDRPIDYSNFVYDYGAVGIRTPGGGRLSVHMASVGGQSEFDRWTPDGAAGTDVSPALGVRDTKAYYGDSYEDGLEQPRGEHAGLLGWIGYNHDDERQHRFGVSVQDMPSIRALPEEARQAAFVEFTQTLFKQGVLG